MLQLSFDLMHLIFQKVAAAVKQFFYALNCTLQKTVLPGFEHWMADTILLVSLLNLRLSSSTSPASNLKLAKIPYISS